VLGITELYGLHMSKLNVKNANKNESLITEMCDKYSKLTTKKKCRFCE